jgi:hypothetical protein
MNELRIGRDCEKQYNLGLGRKRKKPSDLLAYSEFI